MNILKKIKFLNLYLKTIKEHENELYEKLNIKIDAIGRLYTVINMDENDYNTYGGDTRQLTDDHLTNKLLAESSTNNELINGEDLLNQQIDKELVKIDRFLQDIGLSELYGLTKRERVGELSTHLVIEFKFLKTSTISNIALIGGAITLFGLIAGISLGIIIKFT